MEQAPSFLYRFARFVCCCFFKIGWRFEIKGHENIPPTGPVLIAANHRSLADPPLVGVGVSRPVHFLAKKELFNFRPFGWLIENLNAHPLDRKAGVAAMREAQRLLESGSIVIVFPEGKRIKDDALARPKAGVGLLALKTGAAVVPAYIHNSGHMTQLKKISITFGSPINPEKFESYESFAAQVMLKIQELKDETIEP